MRWETDFVLLLGAMLLSHELVDVWCGAIRAVWNDSNVIFWRLFQTLGLGFLLYYQGRDRSWTNRFLQEGKTNQDAFQCWKMCV
jgi:hypothetical protein